MATFAAEPTVLAVATTGVPAIMRIPSAADLTPDLILLIALPGREATVLIAFLPASKTLFAEGTMFCFKVFVIDPYLPFSSDILIVILYYYTIFCQIKQ